MRQQLCDLFEIQKIDLEIRELEKNYEAIPEKLNELDSTVQGLSRDILTVTAQRDDLIREIKGLEGIVKAEAHKVKKWEARLNDIRNQREYLALSREIEGSKRQNRDSEEKLKELGAKRVQVEQDLQQVQERLSSSQTDRDGESSRVDGEFAAARERIAQDKARRETLLPKIPTGLMRKYDAIRAKRAGVGLVAVVDGGCTGCNMKLPPQLYNILQRGDSIEQCPSCVRLIIWAPFVEREAEEHENSEATTQSN